MAKSSAACSSPLQDLCFRGGEEGEGGRSLADLPRCTAPTPRRRLVRSDVPVPNGGTWCPGHELVEARACSPLPSSAAAAARALAARGSGFAQTTASWQRGSRALDACKDAPWPPVPAAPVPAASTGRVRAAQTAAALRVECGQRGGGGGGDGAGRGRGVRGRSGGEGGRRVPRGCAGSRWGVAGISGGVVIAHRTQ